MWTWPEFLRVAAVVAAVQLVTLTVCVLVTVCYVRRKARKLRRMIESTLHPFDPFETNPSAAEELVQKLREASDRP